MRSGSSAKVVGIGIVSYPDTNPPGKSICVSTFVLSTLFPKMSISCSCTSSYAPQLPFADASGEQLTMYAFCEYPISTQFSTRSPFLLRHGSPDLTVAL